MNIKTVKNCSGKIGEYHDIQKCLGHISDQNQKNKTSIIFLRYINLKSHFGFKKIKCGPLYVYTIQDFCEAFFHPKIKNKNSLHQINTSIKEKHSAQKIRIK